MRISRKGLVALGVPSVLLVAAPAALWFLLDADALKGRAAAYVKQQTGRDLAITGPVSMSFFPWVGAEMRGVQLAAPPGFEGPPFVAIDELGVKVKVLPLLGGDVVVDRVVLDGFRIHAVGRRDGRTSFDFPGTPAGDDPASSSVKSVRVEGVSITRGALTYVDETSGSRFAIEDLELTTGPFGASDATDVSLAFTAGGAGQAPARVTMTGRMMLDVPRSQAELTDFTLKLRESTMTGHVSMGVRQKPPLRFDLSVDVLDLDQYLPAASAPGSAAAPATASQDPFEAVRTLEAEGAIRIGRLRAMGLALTDVAAALSASNGIATVKPTAKLYGGRSKGVLTLDARERVPLLKLDQQLARVSVGPLLADLQLYKTFNGTGDVTLRVSARGAETAAVTKSLEGWAAVALRDGRIEGADFLKLIVEGRALAAQLRGDPPPAKPAQGGATSFTSLSASATIEEGVARNTDLVLESPSLRATGAGSIDLGRERIDYVLRASSPQAGNVLIPIAITGSFAAPSYRVQAGAMVKEAAKQELQRQLKKGLGGLFKKKGG